MPNNYVVDRINEGVTKINEFKGDYKELGKLILKFSRETLTFMGIGLQIGLSLGLGVGASMDKKALGEGRQLDIDLK